MTAEVHYDPDGARYEALDNGGFSADRIDGMLGKRAVSAISNPPYPQGHIERSHRSAVRGFGDGELRDSEDPRLIRDQELTPDQRERSVAMIAEIRAGALRELKIAEINRRAELVVPDDPDNRQRVSEERQRFIRAAMRHEGLI